MMHPKVEPVEINMHLVLKRLRIPHCGVGITKPLIPDIHRILPHRRSRVKPSVAVPSSQDDLIKGIGGRPFAK